MEMNDPFDTVQHILFLIDEENRNLTIEKKLKAVSIKTAKELNKFLVS